MKAYNNTYKMLQKRPTKSGDSYSKLTPIEQEVLHLLTKEFLTIKQIAIRRETSIYAVYYILRQLKKKGILNNTYKTTYKKNYPLKHLTPPKNLKNGIRLHGQEFNIKIIYSSYHYRKLQKQSNNIVIDGNTVRLYRNSIEVYSEQSFMAENPQRATALSIQYFQRFFTRLENDLRVIILKSRSANIKQVNAHYAEINNELAEQSNEKKYKISIYTTDEGRLWFKIDNSFQLNEAETLHPTTSKADMEDVVQPFFNYLREHPEFNLSSLVGVLNTIVELQKKGQQQLHETEAGLNSIVKLIQPQQEIPKKQIKSIPEYIG